MEERAAGPWRWLVYLSAPAALGLFVLSAIAVNTESRNEFIRRRQIGPRAEFPDLDAPNFDLPDGPNVDIPDAPGVDLPPVDPPDLTFLGLTLQWLFTIGLFLLAALIFFAVFVYFRGNPIGRRKKRGTALADQVPLPTAARPDYSGEGWRAFEAFLTELLSDPDPTRAVRVGFRYAENGFGSLPARGVDETPNEWERRISEGPETSSSRALQAAITPLIDRYNAVRFGGVEMTPQQRDDSVAQLRLLARAACSTAPAVPKGVHS